MSKKAKKIIIFGVLIVAGLMLALAPIVFLFVIFGATGGGGNWATITWTETDAEPPQIIQLDSRPVAIRPFLVLLEDGSLWVWGSHASRTLVDEPPPNRYTPVKATNNEHATSIVQERFSESVYIPSQMENTVYEINLYLRTMKISSEGNLYGWGDNEGLLVLLLVNMSTIKDIRFLGVCLYNSIERVSSNIDCSSQ